MKYKNKEGIELNYAGNDSHKVLVREVVSEAVRLCSEYNWDDKISMRFALSNVKDFLVENFNLNSSDERSDEWKISQYNRNRSIEDQISTIEEFNKKIKKN